MAWWWMNTTPQLNRIEAGIIQLEAAVNRLVVSGVPGNDAQTLALLNQILTFLEGRRAPTQLSIGVGRMQLISKKGKLIMSGSVTVANDVDLRIPLDWADAAGPVAAPPSGTTGTSDNAAVVATVDVAANDTSIVCRIVGDGVATITVTNGALTDTVQITVTEPAPTSLVVDAADATPVPKGTAA